MDVNDHIDSGLKQQPGDQQGKNKEPGIISRVISILKENKSIEETLGNIVVLLPSGLQNPDFTAARITYMNRNYETPGYRETRWRLSRAFVTADNQPGLVELYYTGWFPEENGDPFSREEKEMIQNIAGLLSRYINANNAGDFISGDSFIPEKDEETRDVAREKLLQRFLDRHNAERDIFHDLQPFRVREILLVANLYDAYLIEGEGRFADHILGEYFHYGFNSVPRVTGVSGREAAMARLRSRPYDMVIIMIGADRENQVNLSRQIKDKYPSLPVFMLINNQSDLVAVKNSLPVKTLFDNYFVWTGNPKVFFAMVSLLEDRINVGHDTKMGLTGVILLVEDSADYYSSYLPMLYDLVLDQTRHLVEDVSTDELSRALKIKARPKILLASNWENAISIFNSYRDNLLCVISDMSFPRKNKTDEKAGFDFISHVRNRLPNLPALLQSSDPMNAKYAFALKASFINKNSRNLFSDLKSFINYYLGFGHFVYRDNQGRQIAVAKTIREFESYLETVPDESLVYHTVRNHFSHWFMARGEVKIARFIASLRIADFASLKDFREYLLINIRKRRQEINRGRVIKFEESVVIDETNVISLTTGSLGGKGRGLAFLNTLIYSTEIGELIPGINIKTPVTAIIGTDEFDLFMDRNHLRDLVREENDFSIVQKAFLKGSISYTLEKKLKLFLGKVTRPLAVRSSSLFEDSMSQPFSGIFGTYFVPNNDPNPDVRLEQLTGAIKLVFSSVYSGEAKSYFEAINYRIELEKMAIVIQEVVGKQYDDVYYPHVSGSAQSFNYYPVARTRPEDGFAVIAAGLGHYVMEGNLAYRFCPAYPTLETVSQKDIYRNSQVWLYAVDLSKGELNLLEGEDAGLKKLDISIAESHGSLNHIASVLNPENDTITPGLGAIGPRILNFAEILRYNYIPLAQVICSILEIGEEACGTPVEIEFAVDLTKDESGNATFYILQIKPLVGTGAAYNIEPESVSEKDVVLLSSKSMGNGVISDITDLIYIEPGCFDTSKTVAMAAEVDGFNDRMLKENRKYILAGPGRWGTRDRFLGIPVAWPQISNAKVIVEVELPGFHPDASLGSHFFHNVTSMNVGYFSVDLELPNDKLNFDLIRHQELIREGEFFRHVRFKHPLMVRMDGKKGIAVISINDKDLDQ